MRHICLLLAQLLTILAITNCAIKDQADILVANIEPESLISTDKLMPNSYIIDSKVGQFGDTLFYWDSSKFQLIMVDKDFNWIGNLPIGRGEGPTDIEFYAGHCLIEDKFFLFGNKAVVFDAKSLTNLGKYQLPDMDVDWIVSFRGMYLMGGLVYGRNAYVIVSSEFNVDDGFFNTKEELEIAFPERLDELSKATIAAVVDDFLFILKPDIGELVKIDQHLEVLYDKQLPFSFSKEENIIDYGDELDINIFESWDFAARNGKLFVLRTLDLANMHLSEEEVKRKTVHVLDLEANPLGIFHLKEMAVLLSFVDNTLITIDRADEKYIRYSMD